MNSKVWFVVRENLVWKYCPDFNCNLWVTVSRGQVTSSRIDEESANKDYADLGFKLRNDSTIQCNDEIVPGESWVRHIVQCRTIL
jgi:hypothetical protein